MTAVYPLQDMVCARSRQLAHRYRAGFPGTETFLPGVISHFESRCRFRLPSLIPEPQALACTDTARRPQHRAGSAKGGQVPPAARDTVPESALSRLRWQLVVRLPGRCAILHSQLVKKEGMNVYRLRDPFRKGGTPAVAGVTACAQQDRFRRALCCLKSCGHLS